MVGAVGRAVIAAIVVASVLAGPSTVLAQSGERLVVDPDGDGYDSISAAVDAASSGDTIEVRPGTYEESVRLETDVRLIAPEGATLDGSATTGATAGIRIVGDAAPEIVGFTIKEYRVGIDAADTSGDWLVRETRVVDSRVIGVRATDAAGDWTILDSAIRDTTGIGIGAFRTTGNWSLVGVSVTGTSGVAVNARNAAGDWRVFESVIGPTREGTTLPERATGVGVRAVGTSGSWEIGRTVFQNNTEGVNATGANPAGSADGVFWAEEPTCAGNVSCGSRLETRPDVGAPNASVAAGGEERADGGGIPLLGILGLGALVAVGGTALAVRTVGRNTVIDAVEAGIAVVVATVSSEDGSGAHRIVLANADSQSVTCRVRCQTTDGVEFEYDLQLDPDERREARELPGEQPFELTVRVENDGVQRTFETPTDVGVRVAAGGVELVT